VALFQLESSSNEEIEFERVRFRELGCGCSYIQNSPANGSNLGRFCRIILPGLTLQYFPSTIGRYARRGPVPLALFNRRHPPCRAPALRIGYLPLNNALGTGPPPLLEYPDSTQALMTAVTL
jgi:hypothetical protein